MKVTNSKKYNKQKECTVSVDTMYVSGAWYNLLVQNVEVHHIFDMQSIATELILQYKTLANKAIVFCIVQYSVRSGSK
jgi:hypothetical protein